MTTTEEPQEVEGQEWQTLLLKIPVSKLTEQDPWFGVMAMAQAAAASPEYRNFQYVERVDADIPGMEGQYDYLVYSAEVPTPNPSNTDEENPNE